MRELNGNELENVVGGTLTAEEAKKTFRVTCTNGSFTLEITVIVNDTSAVGNPCPDVFKVEAIIEVPA